MLQSYDFDQILSGMNMVNQGLGKITTKLKLLQVQENKLNF